MKNEIVFRVVDLRIEKFVEPMSDNSSYLHDYCVDNRFILNCEDVMTNNKYEFVLFLSYGENKSKFRGNLDIILVDKFISGNYVPLKELFFKCAIDEYDTNRFVPSEGNIHNDVFTLYDNGTEGYINLSLLLFQKIEEDIKELRPVWIFYGDDNMGKDFISTMILNNSYLNIYNTDSSKSLPDTITQDIIVVGNKYDFKIKDITSRIYGEHKLIFVDFYDQSMVSQLSNIPEDATFNDLIRSKGDNRYDKNNTREKQDLKEFVKNVILNIPEIIDLLQNEYCAKPGTRHTISIIFPNIIDQCLTKTFSEAISTNKILVDEEGNELTQDVLLRMIREYILLDLITVEYRNEIYVLSFTKLI